MKTKLLFIITYVMLVLLPKTNFAQTPQLGSIANFALFNGGGVINNTGSTIIIGDVGLDNGNIVGFPPGKIIGDVYIKKAIPTQVEIDMDALNDTLTAIHCDSTLNTTLGGNQTLVAGVYCLSSNLILDGTLILDGQGDPNAIFIFKIDGNFSAAKYSNVVLINMASLDNVFWQVNGTFELGDSAVFMGNIITQGNINLLEGSSVFGRVIAHHGAIFLNNNFITTGMSLAPLAIKVSHIKVSNIDGSNRIDWISETENRGDFYELERSNNGKSFTAINVIAANGQSRSYAFIDKHPFVGMNYYRLKLKDASGRFTYSSIVKVITRSNISLIVSVYPNPVINNMTIMIKGALGKQPIVHITDIAGRKLKTLIVSGNRIDVNTAALKAGIYFVNYVDENNNQIIKINKLKK
ncbi:ice-binding family protein [Ferruginibacter sp. SUN002]|uniref:ice-binding family protein n=1 Tax=Ferruginibacter sp. SUN002 TaxID=2937789 RepID=UPI003D3671EE